MAVDVFTADEQADRPIDLDRWAALARGVLEDRRVHGEVEVSLLFVDEPSIAALNERYLGRSGPTDVLAFPIEDEPLLIGRSPGSAGSALGTDAEDGPVTLLGDIVICPSIAARDAAERGVAVDDELALLVVHGLLHLLGMDHETEGEAEAMEHLERELLDRHHEGGGSP